MSNIDVAVINGAGNMGIETTVTAANVRLLELYKKYASKGLGVYAVSLDEKKEDWTNAINLYNSNWMNVSELIPLAKSQYLPIFNVSHTPSIYILNNKGEIIQKNIYKDNLSNYIDSLFK